MSDELTCHVCERTFKSMGRLGSHNNTKKHCSRLELFNKTKQLEKVKVYKESAKKTKQDNKEAGTFRCELCHHNYGSNSDLSKHKRTKKHNRAVDKSDSPVKELLNINEFLDKEEN